MSDTPAETLRCLSVHSIKGGVGKSTLATLLARRAALQGPTALIDMDLTGTSLADVFRLRAPHWSGNEGCLPLNTLPEGKLSWEQAQQALHRRAGEPDPHARHVPTLNDFFLWTGGRTVPDEDVDPRALLWCLPEEDPLSDRLFVLPSSALPADLARILPLIYDEHHAGWIENRLEWLLHFILSKTDIRTVVFDSPPALPGLSRALLSMAIRLPDGRDLAEEGGTPQRLKMHPITWDALLVVSPDHQDLRAADRWLDGHPPEELDRIRAVLNGVEAGTDKEDLSRELRAVLSLSTESGGEVVFASAPLGVLYRGELLSEERQETHLFTVERDPDFRLFRPTTDDVVLPAAPAGFDSLAQTLGLRGET